MANVDEIMQDDEALSYRLVMADLASSVVANVALPGGHVVDLVTRQDGTRAWVDQACERATTPGFPAHVPFIDEAVQAWHDGTLEPNEYDYVAQLRAAGDSLRMARETRSGPRVREARDVIRRLVPLARARTDMTPEEIAECAGVGRATVFRILGRDSDA